jgi:hypothetical protein
LKTPAQGSTIVTQRGCGADRRDDLRVDEAAVDGTDAAPMTLSAEELRSALDLLAAEEAAATGSHREELILELGEDLSVWICEFGFILGVITIWFSRPWGVSMFIVGALGFVALATLPSSDLFEATNKIKSSVENSDLSRAADDLRHRRTLADWTLGLLTVPAVGLVAVGTALLIWHLVADGSVWALAVMLIGVGGITLWVLVAIHTYREFRFYSLISSHRMRLEADSRKAEVVEGGVTVSPEATS